MTVTLSPADNHFGDVERCYLDDCTNAHDSRTQ